MKELKYNRDVSSGVERERESGLRFLAGKKMSENGFVWEGWRSLQISFKREGEE